MKWEYKTERISQANPATQLNKWGEEGWELSAIDRDCWYYFKRPNENYETELLKEIYGKEETVKEARPEEDSNKPQRPSAAGQLYTRAYE